jgi:hypothetical protein
LPSAFKSLRIQLPERENIERLAQINDGLKGKCCQKLNQTQKRDLLHEKEVHARKEEFMSLSSSNCGILENECNGASNTLKHILTD